MLEGLTVGDVREMERLIKNFFEENREEREAHSRCFNLHLRSLKNEVAKHHRISPPELKDLPEENQIGEGAENLFNFICKKMERIGLPVRTLLMQEV